MSYCDGCAKAWAQVKELETKLASYVREHTALVEHHLQSGNDNAELRARIAELEQGDPCGKCRRERDAANARIAELAEARAEALEQRNAFQARVAELEADKAEAVKAYRQACRDRGWG